MGENQVAIVTGASTGIGREIALRLASDGMQVVNADLRPDPERGERYGPRTDTPTHVAIENRGGTASFERIDVADPDACRALVESTLDTYGHVDVLVNNAGIHVEGGLETLSVDDWQRVVDANLSGAFYCSKFSAEPLAKREGSIVNIASVHATEGGSGPAYAASKAGLVNLTRDLAVELGPQNVTVNAVCPGFVKTPRQDRLSDEDVDASRHQTVLPRLGEPEDVASAVAFLTSAEASWITGEALTVDGGWSTHRGP